MPKATDYTQAAVTAARSVLIELTHLLHEYRDNIVLIGGWVPEMLASGGLPPHVGNVDVDLFVVDDVGSIQELDFKHYASGTDGQFFRPPIRLNECDWFGDFFAAQYKFGFGLREVAPEYALELEALAAGSS